GGDRAAVDHLRAREGGLRAALRGEQPARLGADPRRGDRAPARGRGARVTPFDPANPHAFLGAHEGRDGVVVRVYRPEAAAVRVQPMGVELAQADGTGVFEGVVPGEKLPLRYELEVAYPDGNVYTLHDPYAFLPSVGELDLWLAAE